MASAEMKTARNLRQQVPGPEGCEALAASLPHSKWDQTVSAQTRGGNSFSTYHFENEGMAESQTVSLKGRLRWALEHLMEAGTAGCTPIDEPAPRWAAYVHRLRQLGIAIETVTESHDGPFPGTHARYCLRCNVRRASQ